jgi:ABC-2 type transport system permease protein
MSTLGFFRLLLRVNAQMGRRRMLAWREQSALMLAVVGVFVLGYGVGGFAMFHWGFIQLSRFPGLGAVMVDRVLYVFFAFLLLMLFFSNIIIGYAALFKNAETQWLLTLPAKFTDVFAWKLAETTALASWAFLFLSAPLMLAYGVVRHVSGEFYVLACLLFLPFILIPSALGALVVVTVTRFLDRRMFKWVLIGTGAVFAVGAALVLRPMEPDQLEYAQMMQTLNQLLRGSRVAMEPLLPSYWVAGGIVAWSDGPLWKGGFFLLVLLSNALFAVHLCLAASRRWFYEAWSRNHSHGEAPTGNAASRRRISLLEWVVELLPGLERWTRALIVKDIRVFWRDTSQWSQFVIFFGLLGLYVANLRPSAYGGQMWTMFVAFLNLAATAMTLATLTTRFVFPQFSLEGKRLWIIGMAPCGLKHVLRVKFWLSSAFAVAITLSLVLVSGWKLHLPGWVMLLFSATSVLMSFALCGVAVGVGALFPNFGSGAVPGRREDNPARIVSGFGGTFCFVLSMVYIAAVLGAEAWPLYAHILGEGGFTKLTPVLLGVWGFVSVLSVMAASVPMRLALRRMDTLEM